MKLFRSCRVKVQRVFVVVVKEDSRCVLICRMKAVVIVFVYLLFFKYTLKVLSVGIQEL